LYTCYRSVYFGRYFPCSIGEERNIVAGRKYERKKVNRKKGEKFSG